jgi:hypothetical protein
MEDTVEIGPVSSGVQASYHAETLAQWADAIKRYEDMILKAEQQLNIQNQLVAHVGDWQGVVDKARSIEMNANNLGKPFGKGFNSLYLGVDASASTRYTNHNLYAAANPYTVYGTKVTVADTDLKRYAAIEALHDDVLTSFDESDAKIKDLQAAISKTADEIAAAPDQATTDKCLAKMQGLKIALDNVRAVRAEKLARLAEAKAINDSQADKERKIQELRSEQEAKESVEKFGQIPSSK